MQTEETLLQQNNNPRLLALEEAIKRDLHILEYPNREWVRSRQTSTGQNIQDVAIIGGGQGGLAVAFGLIREKVHNIIVIDENPPGFEGPWLTFARMHTLRTPKYLTGPDLGIPNLTPRAWFEAKHNNDCWQNLGLIPKEEWAEYLGWYKHVLNIPVLNHTRAGTIQFDPAENCFKIPLTGKERQPQNEVLFARKIVLATGIDGCGRWDVPGIIRESLPADCWAHTRDPIDFTRLKGKRIAILGAGASAFDNASVALESGAREVHLFHRRKDLPNVNPYRWAEFVGFLKHHGDLPDAHKWKFILQILRMGQLPPHDTFNRAKSLPNFYMHSNSCWNKIEHTGETIRIHTNSSIQECDFIIVGTGFITDLSLREELQGFYPHIALWKDRFTPPAEEKSEDLARHPYLGSNFELQEKVPGSAPYLSSIFNYTFGCLLSLGFGGASISGMKYSVPRLVSGITKQLYVEDADYFYKTLTEYDIQEF